MEARITASPNSAAIKVGDTFTKKLNFPSNYTGTTTVNSKKVKLAGKSVWFTYKITALQKTNTPELNDEFVKTNYSSDKLTTVKAYKEYQKKELKYNKIMNGLWQDYVADCKVSEYNKEQLTQYESQAESQIVAQYSSYGIKDIKTYLEACSMSESDWHKQSKEAIKSRMVIYAIAKEEGLDGDKIYKSEGDAYAKKYYGADVKTLAKNYGESTVKDTLKLKMLRQRRAQLQLQQLKQQQQLLQQQLQQKQQRQLKQQKNKQEMKCMKESLKFFSGSFIVFKKYINVLES